MGWLLGRAVWPPATDLAGGITDFHGHGLDTGVMGGHLDLMTLDVFSSPRTRPLEQNMGTT